MTTDYKVTELFYIIDEFCKHFDAENAGNLLEDNSGVKRRRRQTSLSDSEIMTIGKELVYLSSYATNRYFIPNWGICFNAKPVVSIVSIVVLIICLAMQISSKTVKSCYKIKINYRESRSCFYGFLQHKSHPR